MGCIEELYLVVLLEHSAAREWALQPLGLLLGQGKNGLVNRYGRRCWYQRPVWNYIYIIYLLMLCSERCEVRVWLGRTR